MADDKTTGASGAAQEDLTKNLKEEMNRKFEGVQKNMNSLQQTNQQLLAELQKMSKQAVSQAATHTTKKIDQIWYDNPEEAKNQIKEETKREIMADIQASNATQNKTNSTLNALVIEFPELADSDNDLTKLAVKIYNEMPDDDKTSPIAYKAAVKEAALEMGIKPRSKRTDQENDDFSLKGSGGSQSRNRGNRRGTLDPAVAEFAKLVGVDAGDSKVKERLIRSQNRNWKKWE